MRSDDQAGMGWSRGGGGRRGRSGGWSPLWVIVAVNIAVFVIQYGFQQWGEVVPVPGGEDFDPDGKVGRTELFKEGRVWTLVTHMFVHGDLLHIVFNLLIIIPTGLMVLNIAGNKHFLRVYFLAGVFGALAQMAFTADPLVGASACGFGLLVGLATMIPEEEIRMLLYFVLPLRLRMKSLAYGLVGVSAVFFVLDLLAGPNASIPLVSGVGHAAHLGGALLGWLYVRNSGLGGVRLTRDRILRQRAKNDRKAERKRRTLKAPKRAKIVSIADGKPLPVAESKPKDPARAESDEILDRMNREGRKEPTEEEMRILERNAEKLMSKGRSNKGKR